MAPRNHPVPVTLPHPALPSADWADCYERTVAGSALTATAAAQRTLGDFPAWVRALIWLRNAAVRPFGLKAPGDHPDGNAQMIGLFPVISRSDQQIVLGFDDAHLDFHVVVDVRSAGEAGQIAGVTTLVHRKILMGKLYIAVITPFHRLIVRTMLSRLSHPLAQAD
ncbi:hypothetical protein ADU59_16985 [Pararhizobium polonicum]|uniref:DUF2867 domain-containing protein n=1 Tax=Pararhizobium polonicum TaxID=1612624 RepID=A0A1C7NZM3_9HYPH|nr:DUF2867 domain-containing protein [Pararhizobium polonicum]OBZ94471.1 hypothetical protein ADU59_16985 [Pararhizobium polonicum]